MYFFIAIVFIAELIIAVSVINALRKADRAVLELNDRLIKKSIKFLTLLICIRTNLHGLDEKINSVFNFIQKKRQEIIFRMIRSVLIYIIVFIFETKFSKAHKFKKVIAYGKAIAKGLSA